MHIPELMFRGGPGRRDNVPGEVVVGLHLSANRGEAARAWALVAAQFAILVALLVWSPAPDFRPPRWLLRAADYAGVAGALWLVLGLVSLGRSATALPLPVAHGRLRTGGLYRLSRHPIYTGLLALGWSWAVGAAAYGSLALAAALTALLWAKARFEEAALARTYPGYVDYAERTPRFLPLGFRLRRSSPRLPGAGRG
jgi:protein-S-isoprenylcysteine O-methyltransferase Ste14